MATHFYIKVKQHFRLVDVMPATEHALHRLLGVDYTVGQLVFREIPAPDLLDLDRIELASPLSESMLDKEWLPTNEGSAVVLTDGRSPPGATTIELFEQTANDIGLDPSLATQDDVFDVGTWCATGPWRSDESIALGIGATIGVALVSDGVIVDTALLLSDEQDIYAPETLIERLALDPAEAKSTNPVRALVEKTRLG